MRKKRWVWGAGSVVLIALLFIGFQQWGRLTTSAESISQREAEALVEDRYKGEITKIVQNDHEYIIEMIRNKISYEIKLNASNGEVLSFSKLGSRMIDQDNVEPSAENSADQETKQEIEEGEQTPELLTESAAKEIALKEVGGTVDDIDLESSEDLTYYLVEIETADDREAVVEIHASTGKVLSITWDD